MTGMIVLELLTGRSPTETATLLNSDPAIFKQMHDRFIDRGAGAWPRGAVKPVARVAQRCLEFRVAQRATVKEQL